MYRVLLMIVLATAANGLRLAHSDPDTAPKLCFALPEHDAFMQQSEFLPEPSADDAAALQRWRADGDAVQAEFLTRAKNCAKGTKVRMAPYGIGSSISSVLKPFNTAWKEGGFLGTPVRYSYMSDWGLERMMPECDEDSAPIHSEDNSPDFLAKMKAMKDRSHKDNDMEYNQTMPEEFAEKGNFWWTSQQLAYLIRPDQKLAEEVEALKAGFNWEASRPILALHIRHGDSCDRAREKEHFRTCEDLDVYMTHVRQMFKTYGYKSIYLATDDPSMIEETKKFPEFNWMFDAENAAGTLGRHLKKPTNKEEVTEAHSLLKDLLLMSNADGFVGKFSSNLDRQAVALSYGQKQCAIPHVSLDAHWCNDFSQQNGYNPLMKASFMC